ncbi:hypothetical protein ONS95_007351 [Cadophora gregata]|uniref:uncharacterized protein n=1 Tax=Cadophora gregata TaxID=51156 RepID=UPI0026DDC1E8|nr:uncharacterized protein ONS95_007351 [Cadophora gregata]KAK0100909.1 hypothetical protein ONS95_007351 [Cadophora gregata]KAK0117096.1 hypothetical protein ONS96_012935 [Cadophora gregata f. sp. sojae]
MGDWDCYCALCAAPFHCFDPFNEEFGQRGDAFDPEIISVEDMAWLEKLMLLGFNPNAPGVSKCYITGPASSSNYGSFDCEIGDDANIPPSTDQGSPPKITLTAYSTYDPDEPMCFPFHTDCLKLFSQVVTFQMHGKCGVEPDLSVLNKDVLYATMSKLTEEYHNALSLDYGELADSATEQYWACQPGNEAWVSNPLTRPQITSFLSAIQDQNKSNNSAPTTEELVSPARAALQACNRFTTLAKEIICEILLHLPYNSLQDFTLSGLLPFHLPSISSFWKRKLLLDMPFLWDLPVMSSPPGNGFAWYREMRRQCFATTPELGDSQVDEQGNVHQLLGERDATLVLGLANRRRVWKACLQLAELYEKDIRGNKGEQDAAEVDEEIVNGSMSVAMPIVSAPVSLDAKPLSVYLLEKWLDLQKEWELKFYFEGVENGEQERQGRLCGVERIGGRIFGVRRGEEVSIIVRETVMVDGFVLNVSGAGELGKGARVGVTGVKVLFHDGSEIQVGSHEGDKRLVKVSEGRVLTGLVGELVNGVIQRFGLLECPREITLSPAVLNPATLQRHLWKRDIPPPNLQVSTYKTGYWTPERSFDTIPMSFLLFGTTPSELASITGISSDAKLRSFAVQFADGSERSIGPRDGIERERKVFSIDGRGGEVVKKVEVGMNHLPMAVKLTTSRNRICFFGTNQKNAHTIFEPPPSTHFVAGLYASWGYSVDRKECTTISILSGRNDGDVGQEVQGVQDDHAWSPPGFENARSLAQRSEALAVAGEEDYIEFAGRWW